MNFNIVIKTISKNLKELRKEKKMTQKQVVENIGESYLSLRSYKTYESGRSNRIPTLEKLATLAEFYNVSLDYLVFNKSSTYDDSFTKRDQLKRLGRLIHSAVLIAEKDTNSDSPTYGKYCFVSYDNDVTLFLDAFKLDASLKDRDFLYKGIQTRKGIFEFDQAIQKIDDLNEDWKPSPERYRSVLIEAGEDPDAYYKSQLAKISKARKVGIEKNKLNK